MCVLILCVMSRLPSFRLMVLHDNFQCHIKLIFFSRVSTNTHINTEHSLRREEYKKKTISKQMKNHIFLCYVMLCRLWLDETALFLFICGSQTTQFFIKQSLGYLNWIWSGIHLIHLTQVRMDLKCWHTVKKKKWSQNAVSHISDIEFG